jgi:hypothetical protein
MQPQSALLIAATHCVHERRPQLRKCPGKQWLVATRRGFSARLAQDLHAGFNRAGLKRRLARFELRQRRLSIACSAATKNVGFASRARKLRTGSGPQLAPEQRLTFRELPLRIGGAARPRKAADQQLLPGLIKRVV